jgi:AbrB family looped-hinge helix DNA binding protein
MSTPADPRPARVSVGKEGRVTLPARMREALHLEEGTQLEVEVDLDYGGLRLRPAITVPRDHAWAYTTKHLTQLTRARTDAREGRTAELSEEEMLELLRAREQAPKGTKIRITVVDEDGPMDEKGEKHD